MDSWTESFSPEKRIEMVATTLSQPRKPNWIAEQAEVTLPKTYDILEFLVYLNVLTTVEDDEKFYPNPAYLYFEEIHKLASSFSRTELQEEREELEKILENTPDPEKLRQQAEKTDKFVEQRELLTEAETYEQYVDDLTLLEKAIENYEIFSGYTTPAEAQ